VTTVVQTLEKEMRIMFKKVALFTFLALLTFLPKRSEAQGIIAIGNANDDSCVVRVSVECNVQLPAESLYVGEVCDEYGDTAFAIIQADGEGKLTLTYSSGSFVPHAITFLLGDFYNVSDGTVVEDFEIVVLSGIKKVEVSDLDKDAKNRIIDLQDSPVRDIKDAGDNQWKKYKNNTDPKLPEGGDYQEIYVADGDKKKRFVYDWTKGQEKLYYTEDHYETWVEVNDPWKHGGPKFPPPKY
jgi:hypothetical protein